MRKWVINITNKYCLKRKSYITCVILCFLFTTYSNTIFSQTENPVNNNTEQQIEDLTSANDDTETEDDVWLQQMEDLKKHPININTADESELILLRQLSQLQIRSLLSYRKLVGNLISVYELQAIPNWDVETIKKVLPFITVENKLNVIDAFRKRFKDGETSLLARLSQTVEQSRGFKDSTSSGNFYPGSPQRLLVRYRYNYKNLLQYGFTAEKDPGEQFFKGAQKNGFDFYSVHLFARNIGKVKALALGDFTVNMGQGLIQWQGLAFRKSAEAMMVKRSSPVLRPYNAAGEFNFFRGAGATIQISKNVEATVFGSYRLRDANVATDTTLFNDPEFATSLQTSGLHRTKSELADKNSIQQMASGANISLRKKRWHAGVNAVLFNNNKEIQRADDAYNNFAVRGKQWYNASVDYSYTYKNFHYFGESAISKNGGYAFVDGILVSLDSKVDMSMVLRNISKKYQAMNANAFTEGTFPTNESGIYTGITIRPVYGIKIDAYADFYQFPFLRYRVDAPSRGRDYLLQINYKPNKVVDGYLRFRSETKDQNISGLELPARPVVGLNRKNLRAHVSYKLNAAWQIRQRAEMVWYDQKGTQKSSGFSVYTDLIYKPMLKPLSVNMRLQYFDTDDYNSRIYAFENDVLYSFSIPLFYDKGYRYYTNINYDLTRKLSLWLRWAQTIYLNRDPIGSGLDEISGNRRSDFRVQLRWMF
jgi:DNA uptake protein ComE-like DNA-binding protein